MRWDKKRSHEPNLYVCGKDGIKRTVYNMKEKHAERDRNKKRKTQRTLKREKLRNQSAVLVSK